MRRISAAGGHTIELAHGRGNAGRDNAATVMDTQPGFGPERAGSHATERSLKDANQIGRVWFRQCRTMLPNVAVATIVNRLPWNLNRGRAGRRAEASPGFDKADDP